MRCAQLRAAALNVDECNGQPEDLFCSLSVADAREPSTVEAVPALQKLSLYLLDSLHRQTTDEFKSAR